RRKPRNQNLLRRSTPETGVRYTSINKTVAASSPESFRQPVFETCLRPGRSKRGIDVMLSNYRHWLEYDHVSLAVLLVGVGFVELIVLNILGCGPTDKVPATLRDFDTPISALGSNAKD